MPHVVITGASRGLGFCMAREFAGRGWMVTISGRDGATLGTAVRELDSSGAGTVAYLVSDISKEGEADRLWGFAAGRSPVDVWINNAGINQRAGTLDTLPDADMDRVVTVNLLGTMHGLAAAYRGMAAQGFGRVYTMEGLGSNGMMASGMTVYGASKAALTYCTESFAREHADSPVAIGRLSPGMMLTDFLLDPLERMPATERSRLERLYDILADDPADVARFLVARIVADRSKKPHIVWLTQLKAFARFAAAPLRKRGVVAAVRAKSRKEAGRNPA